MKLPTFKRLNKADFPKEFAKIVDTLSTSLNIGIENLYNALNSRLSLSDNFLCDVKDVEVTVDSDGVPTSLTSFQISDTITALKGLQVIRADNIKVPNTYPSSGIFISYTLVTSGVQILHVTGLQAAQAYRLRIIAWG